MKWLITYCGGSLPEGAVAFLDGVTGPTTATQETIDRVMERMRKDGYKPKVYYGEDAERELARLKRHV